MGVTETYQVKSFQVTSLLQLMANPAAFPAFRAGN